MPLDASNALYAGALAFFNSEFIDFANELLISSAALAQTNGLADAVLGCGTTGGQTVVSVADNDGDKLVSSGDRVQLTYQGCAGTDGTMSLSIASIVQSGATFDQLSGDAAIDLTLSQDGRTVAFKGSQRVDFTIEGISLRWESSNADLSVTIDGQTVKTSAARTVKSIGLTSALSIPRTPDKGLLGLAKTTASTTTASATTAASYTIELSGTVEASSGKLDYHTDTPFSGPEGGYPLAGQLTIEGSSSSVEFRANDDPSTGAQFARYNVDPNGDGRLEPDVLVDWTQLLSGILFGVEQTPEDPPPNDPNDPPGPVADLHGRRVDLGAVADDGLADFARGRLYFSLTSSNVIAVVDLDRLQVTDRPFVGPGPKGLALGADGVSLYVALSDAGAVGVLDPTTLSAEQIVVAPELGSSIAFDVAEAAPGVVFVSGDPGSSGFSYVVRVDRNAGDAVSRAAGGRIIRARPELLPSADGTRLYVGEGFSPNSLYKLDATDPEAPIILEDQHGSVGGTDRMSLSPDGARIFLRSGQVLRTGSFIEDGRIGAGIPVALSNGAEVMVATAGGALELYDAVTLQLIDSFTTDCAFADAPTRLIGLARPGQWLLLGGSTLCAVDINNPDQPPGEDGAGVPPSDVETITVSARQKILNEVGFDLEHDALRGQLFVSLPASGEIVALAADTLAEVGRFAVGNAPRGIDLSPSAAELAIAFNRNGSIGFLNPDTATLQTADLSTMLDDVGGHDVAYVDDDSVFISASPGSGGFAYVVKTTRADPTGAQRVASNRIIRAEPELLASGDGKSLFVGEGFSPNSLYRLDLTQPDAPLVAEDNHGTVSGTSRLALNGDASRIALTSGQVLRTTDFTQAGKVSAGIPQFTADGGLIVVAASDGMLHGYDARTFQERYVVRSNCSVVSPTRFQELPSLGQWALLGDDVLCLIPAGWNGSVAALSLAARPLPLPAGRHRCDGDCLVRRYVAPLLRDPQRRLRQWQSHEISTRH